VGGLVRLGGSRMVLDLADFFTLVESMFDRMLARVRATQRWLHEGATQILVVTSSRHDGARTAMELVDALSKARLAPSAVVVNRALPVGLEALIEPLEVATAGDPWARPVLRYARSYANIQARVVEAVRGLAARTALVPDTRGLDGDSRLESLARIGDVLRAGLE
jgi:hypothetical protein